MTRVLVVGEPLLELLESPPGTLRTGFGGDALNLAVYLAREAPEVDVALATAVGSDPGSDAVMAFCLEERVDVSGVRRVDGAALGRYRVTVDGSGERTFAYERSDSPFRASLDDGDGLPDGGAVDIVCFSGIGLAVLHDAGRRALLAYVTAVHDAGGMVVYDPNHRPALWGDDDARRWTTRIAAVTDLLLASTEDGRRLTGARSAHEIARTFRALGAAEVVVTDGAQPCVVATDVELSIDAAVPAEVVDTTAAGDAFDAGYLAARLRGESPAVSAAAGHARAATVVGHRGAFAPAAGT